MKRRYSILCLIVIFLGAACQEEGCTDPNALNFDATADKDDGSCITCPPSSSTSTLVFLDSIVDFNFGSFFFEEEVFEVSVNQVNNASQIIECNTADTICITEVSVKNITTLNMTNFDFEITLFGSEVFLSDFFSNIELAPGQDTILIRQQLNGSQFFDCPRYSDVSMQAFIIDGDYFE